MMSLIVMADYWFEQMVNVFSYESIFLLHDAFLSQEESSRHASVRPGVDYPATVHQFVVSRPLELVTMILQVCIATL